MMAQLILASRRAELLSGTEAWKHRQIQGNVPRRVFAEMIGNSTVKVEFYDAFVGLAFGRMFVKLGNGISDKGLRRRVRRFLCHGKLPAKAKVVN